MKTIAIKVPDEILGFLGSVSKEQEKFVLEAIKEKVNREKKRDLKTLLVEGYQATSAAERRRKSDKRFKSQGKSNQNN